MRFDQFIKVLASRAGAKQKDARAVLRELPGVILDAVRAEGRLVLPGLGVFRVKELPQREYVAPTGARVLGGGKKTLRFVPTGRIKREGL